MRLRRSGTALVKLTVKLEARHEPMLSWNSMLVTGGVTEYFGGWVYRSRKRSVQWLRSSLWLSHAGELEMNLQVCCRLELSRVILKIRKLDLKSNGMGTIELKSNLHKLVDIIEDERLLRAIYSFLDNRENSEDGRMWKQLTEEQRQEVLRAYDESEDDANLIDDEDVWKDLK